MVRLKHRYLLINILYPDSTTSPGSSADTKSAETVPYTVQFRQPSSDRLDAKFLLKLIRDGVAELFGDYGSGMIAGSLQVKYFSPATSTAIIRVSRDHYRLVWAALTFTTHLPKPVDRACVIQVVRVSGTIKKAEEEAIRRARLSIKRAQRAVGSLAASGNGARGGGVAGLGGDMDVDDSTDFANGIEDPDDAESEEDDDD